MKLSQLLGASALASATFLIPQVAFAQASQPAEAGQVDNTATAEEETTIVVTGSRIRRPNDDSPVPVTTVTAEEIFETGRVSVGDVLNDLPQLRTSMGSQNSTSGLGTRGVNFLDLRGLGRARTLALINGRRQTSADIINNGNAIDINTLPTDLIERVDIVTGGNSSIYGSDAIAGVVNFILKDSYDGVQIRAQSGISTYGDAGNQYVSLVAGKNFAEGRGNIAINAEFAHQDDYYASGRPNLRQNDAFVIVDTDTGASFDSVPDRLYYRDIRSATIGLGGQVGIRYANTPTAPCGVDAVGSSYTCGFLFQPGGTLTPQQGLRIGLGPNGNYVGGNGTSSREGKLTALSPDLKRYVFNALGHFEVSPAFQPYFEAKYVRTEAFGTQSGPFFSQGQTLGDGVAIAGFNDRSYASATGGAAGGVVNREGIRLDNPFLSAAARATITGQLTAAINSGVNPNTGTAYGTTAAGLANQATSLAQIAAGTYRFSLRRNWVDLGTRDEQMKRELYRGVLGIKGDLGSDWSYDVSANYSEHKESSVITGNVNTQRYLLALDTTTNGAGQIVCRSQVTPAYAGDDVAGNAAQLAADVAACVPLNPFGQGSVSQAALNYLVTPTTAVGKSTQFVASGFVSGNLPITLPGGAIGVSVGAEYRKETLSYDLDDLTQAGYAFYNAIPSFTSPAFEVKEVFGEISLPLIKDVTLLQELTINGSGRIADYQGGAGTVYAFSGGATWRPVRDLLLRGSYSKSVRAPYLGDLYSVPGQNFTPAPSDPCSTRNINTGSATREANCAAAGRPAGYDYVYTASLEILSGGNPNLKSETSKSITLGGVFQPSFVPGLAISVDYYDITVDDVITSPAVQSALNACYDAPDLNNQFCALFERAGAAGGPRGEQPFRILEGSYQDSPQNYAQFKARGIDTQIGYNRDFGWGKLSMKGVWTHVIQRDNFTDPARPTFKNVLAQELGDPEDNFNIGTDLQLGPLTLGHTFRYIGRMYLNTFEDYNSVNGQPAQNVDYATLPMYPSTTYHDVRFDLEVNDSFNFYGGVTNVGDTKPQYGLTGIGAGSGIYDNRGRFFYAGVTAKF
ncbi:TonB-dependent receptor domain-containing protein [Sphingomonas sp. LM7]|uniref:TonB-dependent receptor domain-containing protein n=1 Tax=Sphingomonas sp. LM7 TaxID=1938607 RepID=UPI000983D94F|nr:TonB-dependent receptor [Sphingomonas sp. LM7]AQR75255.1 TonB-dependent receptor [Sphingomonas sp. LM7]